MNSRQRKTMERLFRAPVPKDLAWRQVASLLTALGFELEERSGMSSLMYRDYRCDVYADATGVGWEGVVTGEDKQSLGTFFTRHESEIRSEFHTTVDEYLAVCRERGFPPISPIRSADPIPPQDRRKVAEWG